ncbi:MAG: Transcription-repair-coupling factor [candidate division TA06 bacterium ADurb.Bin131]|uniref:Transcription-repair-coupling factor n=1 Tax=candidate division TA06 bacterium ADurb.Bin131 TaxID=1852827 RepID=A0A1V6CBM2_UNCT6|nr:MAG: Transcription-repair-coupling factor [candidate division TA06 bacterium ADurb.Bin131]
MLLQEQIELLKNFTGWTESAKKIKDNSPVYLCGGNPGFFSFLISSYYLAKTGKLFLVICNDPVNSENFYANIKTFLPDSVTILPEKDIHLPMNHPIKSSDVERVKNLVDILKQEKGILVTSIQALSIYLPDKNDFISHIIDLKPQIFFKRDNLIARLIMYGYEEVDVVENPGEFARRGGIIDFFPYDNGPFRIEFTGEKIISIRSFDVQNQKSTGKIDRCTLYSLNEIFISSKMDSTIFDYLNNDVRIFTYEKNLFEETHSQLSRTSHREVKNTIINWEILKNYTEKAVSLETDVSSSGTIKETFVFPVDVPNRFGFNGDTLFWNKIENENVFIVEENKTHRDNLKKILSDHKIKIEDSQFLDGYLSHSFSFPVINLTMLNTPTLFNVKPGRALHRFMEHMPVGQRENLHKGEYVVHYQHGIARFDGFEKIGPEKEEFIRLEFAEGEKLYLPLSDIDFIHRYIGSIENPQLSRLGSKTWIRIRDSIKTEIHSIAEHLYNLYIERKHARGFVYPEDDELQRMLEESFPFEETPDQIRSIEEVKKDLQSPRIMDRLLCGDSGYGKTEIAVRAAFKVVSGGKQVAILCPTTVLAQQHLRTFRERTKMFPVSVEMLSRLQPEKEQKKILQKIAHGQVDIIIGTHRILQKDVIFKDLGLLIVDEEQRFGVLHKEKLKTNFRNVEVLTLTATPIPRTLYFSLSGLRDISLLESPPTGRLSVSTYIGRYNETIVKMAIVNELKRQGQVFYLHNRIYDIEKIKNRLQQMFPQTSIAVAHGRMKEDQILSVMNDFADGKIQILVATTIVENGLDVPNANTLIVDNAHLFGLADLYQLRGRVGRYKVKAYSYFLIPAHMPVSITVKERLKALDELVKPGSGMKVAIRDLQIRGAGDILGKKQSGYINQVGFQLYCRFWKEITSKYTGEKVQELTTKPSMRGFLDPEWVPSPSLRFEIYKRISEIHTKNDAEIIVEEMKDRFGNIPDRVKKLIFDQIENK